MKRLTRLKLIHWHYFVNETVSFRGSTLLTGENGSGKSTILDAIQFALVGDQRKVKFNVSAHEETRRDLRGYLRAKTGSDTPEGTQDALRDAQDFTSYVALEFFDTRAQTFFLVGTVIDSYASGDLDIRFFKLENQELDDALFLLGGRPRNITEFRLQVTQRLPGATLYTSAERYRDDLLAKLGHLNERFFALLTKAVAFKPITDLRDFVYTYLLEERSVNIDAMRQNLQTYRHFDNLVQQTKEKIAKLQDIAAAFAQYTEYQRRIVVQSHVIHRARETVAEQALEAAEAAQERAETELLSVRARLGQLDTALRAAEEELQQTRDTLRQNDTQQRIQLLEAQHAQVNDQLARARASARQLTQLVQEERQAGSLAVERLLAAEPWLGDTAGLRDDLSDLLPSLARIGQAGTGNVADDLELFSLCHRQGRTLVGDRRARLIVTRDHLHEEQTALERELEALRQRRRVYSEPLLRLQRAIREEIGERAEVLCELLEVADPLWQNAVEGYLNTQRFDLLVRAEAFDAALRVYEQRKMEHRIENVGLVNTAKILAEARPPQPGSLAEEVVTAHPAARAYVNRLLGNVMKCLDEQDLKRHRVAITPTCMTYRNHVARQMNFKVYETWYIGERAFAKQIEVKEARLAEVQRLQAAVATQIEQADQLLELLRDRRDRYDALTRLHADVQEIAGLEQQAAGLARQLEAIDRSEVAALAARVQWLQERVAALQAERSAVQKQEGRLEQQLESLANALVEEQAALREAAQARAAYVQQWPETAEEAENRFQEQLRSQAPGTIKVNFERSRQQHETLAAKAFQELFSLRTAYNNAYQFGGNPSAPGNEAYDAELHKLADSELPDYESKIASARHAAEQEFKEHFVYRLKEQIETARREFQDLNQVLKDIRFGQDRYQFQVGKAPEYAAFHDMITDDMLLAEGYTLFSQDFQSKHQATIDELFREILDVSEEMQARNVQKFTDYRTYLDYDIKIHHANGEISSFSKVAREKSGGETQTPYYVAMVASFLQLYRHRFNDDSVRLLIFDEAFNRMDLDRIEKTLRFINQSGLQLICAAPTDKAEVIAPLVGTTLLVMRDGHQTWVQDYHQFMDEAALLLESAAASDQA